MQIISSFKVHPVVTMIGIIIFLFSSSFSSFYFFFLKNNLLTHLLYLSYSYYTHEMAFNYGNYDRANDRYLVYYYYFLFYFIFIYF